MRCPDDSENDKIPKQKQRMHELETIATNWLKKNDMRDVKVHARGRGTAPEGIEKSGYSVRRV